MKHIETVGELPDIYKDMLTLLDDAMAALKLPGLEPLLCVQFTDGFSFPSRPARILIHALMGGCANHPDELEIQSKEISSRHVLITTDYTKYDISYQSEPREFGSANTPAEEFLEQTRLKLPYQIVNFIFLGKNPFTE